MLNWLKWILWALLVLIVVTGLSMYVTLQMSLPSLGAKKQSAMVSAPLALGRDVMGQAIITAENRNDAAFALGFAHAQDRFFQMDLQRRVAAGELAAWLGPALTDVDKRARFHQFRQRAQNRLSTLPASQLALLRHYADGVNAALDEYDARPLEYLLTGFSMQPWQPEDSLLVVYSMYMDLQLGQVELDMARTALADTFGADMLAFINQPGRYQAALDDSRLPQRELPIPPAPDTSLTAQYNGSEPPDIGSNNWAVSGDLTEQGGGMLANDMHLGLRVPIIWYRAQLNYQRSGKRVQTTGVTLPGLPGIVVGTNGHIAWGFTNANLDNVDWVKLNAQSRTWQVTESILTTEGETPYVITMSDYGPVQTINGEQYALSWVAHQPYAVNLTIADLDLATGVEDAMNIAADMAIPVQNMLIVDEAGNAGWTPGGAVTGRETSTMTAIAVQAYSDGWKQPATELPRVINPPSGRLWSANARVIGADQLSRLGDGGYALGARAMQIRDRLSEQDRFTEEDFYRIQLDNEARFLLPWHTLLSETLEGRPDAQEASAALSAWGGCACADSVGYTLVKAFRQQVMQSLLARVMSPLEKDGIKTSQLLRQVEPALWQLINQQPEGWLPPGTDNWDGFFYEQFENALSTLLENNHATAINQLRWGDVNTLKVHHPLAKNIPILGSLLNMPDVQGFGDTFMPAVQAPAFGASQRLFVRPGALEDAVLTIPGGQSGHPLSPYYHIGFTDYANHLPTPLLPGKAIYTRRWEPMETPQ